MDKQTKVIVSLAFAATMMLALFGFFAWLLLTPASSQGAGIALALQNIDTPADEECVTWESTDFGLEFQSCLSDAPNTVTAVANQPTTAIGTGIVSIPHDATFVDVFCIVTDRSEVATPTIDIRAATTPFTAGTALLTADLGCDSDGKTSTSFNQATLTADQNMAFTISAVSTSTIDQLYVRVRYTID